jgi:tetratricopeptide (TPR) repeat protein
MKISTMLISLLALVVCAQGQVRQLNTGQVLDANNQIGSGGYNYVAGGQGGVNSQLYINGQTTGLTPFQGRVGYFAPNQLNLQLPTAEFDTFHGQSIGLGDISRTQTYMTNPYYNRNQTVIGAKGIAQGQNAPGSSIPINSIAQPVAPYVYADVIKAYAPIVTDVGVAPVVAPPVISSDTLALSKYISSDMATYGPGAPIFSGLSDPQRQKLANELYDLAQREEPNAAQVNANVNPEVNAQAGAPKTLPPIPAASQEPPANERRPLPAQPKGTPTTPEPGAAPTVPANQDIFSDVLMKLYQQRTQKTTEQPAPSNPGGEAPTPAARPTSNNALVELRGNEVFIHSLAGGGKDSFNLYMALAQAKMKNGKFYAASRDYESALVINPSNPLALEGAGLAKFAAGEAYSAAFELNRAIETFPPLMETRLDIAKLVDDETFGSRLAALDQRLSAGPDREEPLLLMLATFLHQNAGQTDKAKTYAQLLKNVPKATKLMQTYADYVTTGKKPAQPTILKAK